MTAFKYKEPVLLIGGTGIGKTLISNLIAKLLGVQLYYLNCHKGLEVSDFMG